MINKFKEWMRSRRLKKAKQIADEIYGQYTHITLSQREDIEYLVANWKGPGLVTALCVRFDLTVDNRRTQ